MPIPLKTNPELDRTVRELKALSREHGAPIWRAVAERLAGPRRNWPEVNLSRVARHAPKGSTVVVPGVLLSSGTLSVPITVGAFRASGAARRKVEAAGGHALSLLDFARQHPKGAGVRILG
ncbi:MAG: 50S ribosomal protein L18e [Methanobacteriota archaeon]|nr:MAG: 50S ribosomal protein L18e [Euryarchaeota archaeon]